MEEIEIWKDIEGYEGLYQVSNLGQIASMPKTWKSGNNRVQSYGWRVLKLSLVNGYVTITLRKYKKMKSFKVSRLVAIHFIPNHENKPEVNHVKGNKLDNRASQLEWNTSKENVLHSFRTGLKFPKTGESNNLFKHSDAVVDRIRSSNKTVSEISKDLNIPYGTVYYIVKNKRRKSA